ncbi:hypothetical protein C3451_02365 [Enterobacter sp. 301B]|uniref:hypothetical protein n=1 Tax=Enterobacter sp. 301B TaxID=2079206 RepID=UPI000F587834|nr:hypothetical protein [Enterobacter sp. 301B]RQN46961.1 hypothetical protein C3451_02365 [Enterobacter sp. 301B]
MFKFELGQQVTIKASGEKGTVEACAKYISSGNSYYIHYRAADGRAVTQWFEERHIEDGTACKSCDCPLCYLLRPLPQVTHFTFDLDLAK